MKVTLVLILAFFLNACSPNSEQTKKNNDTAVPPIDKTLAAKPPMGWNSWTSLGWGANEAEVRANAAFMAKNLKHLGYEYIVIDQMWYGDEKTSDFEDFVHERMSPKPHYSLDEYGRLLPDTIKYPSAKGGKGFKPLADYIHSLGLKFGLHLVRGIPWEAVDKNMPIKETDLKAASIGQPDKGCDWYDGFYGVDMSKPGGQAYYNSVFKLFAAWELDFVKADDMVNVPELEGMSKALRTSGRKMVFSVVPDNIPQEVLKENTHMARTGFDFWDVWQMLKVGFPVAAKSVKQSEPGFWPDLDILPIGKVGKKISYKGPDERISNFTKPELHTLFSLFYISKMPLMIGSYLPETDSTTLQLLQNEEALAVNRNCINPRQIKFKNAVIIWAADIPDSKDKYLACFNPWESKEPVNMKVLFSQLGLTGESYTIRDLWKKADIGVFKNEFAPPIGPHDAGLYRISGSK
jgi:alpha-galactosidase